jgi:hypothetical protein
MADIIQCPQDLILLFDECGTPSFRLKAERQYFLGVSVRYAQAEENGILEACNDAAGLSNKSPKKNDQLGVSTALHLARVLSGQPVAIYARYVDLRNSDLRKVIEDYGEAGNRVRMAIRAKHEAGVRPRKTAQILHCHMLYHCLFEPVLDLIQVCEYPLFSVHPFIDAWSIPLCDKELYLNGRSESMQEQVNKLLEREKKQGFIAVKPVIPLENSSVPPLLKRKRLVDAVTSTISRSGIFAQETPSLSDPLPILISGLGEMMSCVDITSDLAADVRKLSKDILNE